MAVPLHSGEEVLLLFLLLPNLPTNHSFLHTKDVGTSLGQVLEVGTDLNTLSEYLFLRLLLCNLLLLFLPPARIKQT